MSPNTPSAVHPVKLEFNGVGGVVWVVFFTTGGPVLERNENAKTTRASLVQPVNRFAPNDPAWVNPDPTVTDSMLVHCSNALSPMEITLFGMTSPDVAVLPTNAVQLLKHLGPIAVPDPALSDETVAEIMFNPVNLEHPMNACSCTLSTDAGIFRVPLKLLQFRKD